MSNDNCKIKNFAANLRLLAEHHSLSLRKLAKVIGISHGYAFKLIKEMRTNPSMEVVEKITRIFKISLSELFGESDIDFTNRPKELELELEEE